MIRALRRLVPPLLLFVAVLVVWLLERDRLTAAEAEMGASAVKTIAYAVEVLIWLAGAWLVSRALDVLLWVYLIPRRLEGRQPPRLLRVLLSVLVFAIAVGGIVGVVFDQSLNGLWATSGVFGIVLGFALKDIIADFFSGLAVNLDRSYEIGDWVEVHYQHLRETLYGRVVEINWRTTRIEMDSRNVVVVPNNAMGAAVLINYSSPDHAARLEIPLTLDYSVPVERALRVLHAGALAALGRHGLLTVPPPQVILARATPLGVDYLVRFWIRAAEITPPTARSVVLKSVLDHLDRAGLTPAIPKQDLYLGRIPVRQLSLDSAEDRNALLAKVELFAEALTDGELAALARDMELRLHKAGETLIRQGEPGASMFVLAEGLAHVEARDGEGHIARVSRLRPGQIFGEMSLLTGEPRAATVIADSDAAVFEIAKESLAPLLVARPAIAETTSRLIAARRLGLDEALSAGLSEAAREEAATLSHGILASMRRFFGLGP